MQAPATTMSYMPPEFAEYTMGVSGCGKRVTYLVVCAQGETGASRVMHTTRRSERLCALRLILRVQS